MLRRPPYRPGPGICEEPGFQVDTNWLQEILAQGPEAQKVMQEIDGRWGPGECWEGMTVDEALGTIAAYINNGFKPTEDANA